MTDYVKRKITGITTSAFLCAAVFVFGALYIFWEHSAGRHRDAWQATLVLCGLAAVVVAFFPVSWMIWPQRHPVRKSLARWGDADVFAERLNAEIAAPHEACGPFHFTATLLIYDPGYTLEVVPFDQIVSAQHVLDSSGEGTTHVIEVVTSIGHEYQWYRTWIQGRFDPRQVLAKICGAARLAPPLERPVRR